MTLESRGTSWHVTRGSVTSGGTLPPTGNETIALEGGIFVESTFACPHCQSASFFRCGTCGQVNCWDTRVHQVTCAACHVSGELGGTMDSLSTFRG